jgi:hypothetical protein
MVGLKAAMADPVYVLDPGAIGKRELPFPLQVARARRERPARTRDTAREARDPLPMRGPARVRDGASWRESQGRS